MKVIKLDKFHFKIGDWPGPRSKYQPQFQSENDWDGPRETHFLVMFFIPFSYTFLLFSFSVFIHNIVLTIL